MERHTLTHRGIYSVNASAPCSLDRMHQHACGNAGDGRRRRDGLCERLRYKLIFPISRLMRHLPLIVKIHNTLFACILVWESIMQAGAIAQSC
jgi:hypothetical protein